MNGTPSIHRRFLRTESKWKSYRLPVEKLLVHNNGDRGRRVWFRKSKLENLDGKGWVSSGSSHCLKSYFDLDFWYCLNSCCFFGLDFFLNFCSKLNFPSTNFFFETSFGKLAASWFSPLFFHGQIRKTRREIQIFRFLRVRSRNFGFWEEKVRFLGVKNWIWVLRRKNQISWSEKSKFGFWEEKIRFLGVKNRNLGSEKKKTDFVEWAKNRNLGEKKKSDF